MPRPAILLLRHADTAALGVALVIALLSLLPADRLPDVGGNDKLHHLLAYAALGLLATLRRQDARAVLTTLLAITAYGAAIELLQPLSGRFMEAGDLLANAIGAGLGALVARPLRRLPGHAPEEAV